MKLLNKKNQDKDILYNQYELYVNGAENVSERRMASNAFMWAIQGGLITLLGAGFGLDNKALLLFCPLFGIASSYIWKSIIKSYKQLNSGKFKVIHELEGSLPANLYAYEWQQLGEGNNPDTYQPTSHIESVIPNVCLVFWIASLGYWIFSLVDVQVIFELIVSLKK